MNKHKDTHKHTSKVPFQIMISKNVLCPEKSDKNNEVTCNYIINKENWESLGRGKKTGGGGEKGC